ncbi:DUF3833 domain-containing protein [Ostreibacterium oceani]|uniref:DUF3833 domain-containing protein n=1 Tax=Ostreibacterium oceani TaxID=2654998 RepID=UPI001C4057CF|nr:DUF3833 domain-containing protein [Ostreibacterium oceani]
MKIKVLLMSITALISACFGDIKGEQYDTEQPKLELSAYFDGPIKAWGIIQDRSGNITTRFDVEIIGQWQGDQGILDETFRFYDGKVQTRRWEITKIDGLNYVGTAGDIIGEAKGKAHGNAVYWTYTMDVPVDDTHYRLKFDDWMWLMNDDVLINRSYMKKFGITVAELTIFMQKQSNEPSNPSNP